MFASFIESVRYSGHLFPVAFLRVFVGYYYLDIALSRIKEQYLQRPQLASDAADIIGQLGAMDLIRRLLESTIIPNWQIAAYLLVTLELVIGISYLLGYVVRPASILALIYCYLASAFLGPQKNLIYHFLIAIHFFMAWVGAGRCLGFDYYFFKRRRGLWW
jgi:thiosulfate dehydrogenase [quinone] large subunit